MSAAVPPGYKQTEVGVIPEDWKVARLGDFCTCFSGGTPSTSNPAYYNGEIPWITSSDLNLARINEVEGRITDEGLINSSAKMVKAGTLLLALYGATAGVAAMTEVTAAINQAVLAIQPKKHEVKYLFEYLRLRKEFLIKTYTQGGQPNFSGEIVKSFLIALPHTKLEQQAIAEALSDADALIEGLEALITKKRQLRQGAMQGLISGRNRIVGFHDEWSEVRLGELFEFKNGLNKAKAFFGYGVPIVNYMDVYSSSRIHYSNLRGRVSLTAQEIKNFDVRRGDVFFTRTSETPGEIGIASVVLDEAKQTVFSGFVLRGRPKDGRLSNEFKAYCFQSEYVRKQIISQASYTTRALTNGRLLSKVVLPLPCLQEQAAIAAILADMDAEIVALEGKLVKARRVKAGMMQDLLTGRVRLV